MGVYQETVLYLQNDRAGDYLGLLHRIPLSRMEDEMVDDYFTLALKLCTFYNAIESIKTLYNYFIELFGIEETEIPYFVHLMGEVEEVDIFIFLHQHAAKHFTYEEILDVLIMYFNKEKVGLVISKCEMIFGRQPLQFYREMYRRSVEETPNVAIAKVLSKFLRDDEIYAPYPEWTFPQAGVPYLEDVVLPKDIKFDVEIDNLENVAKMIMEMSELEGEEYSQEKARILSLLYKLPEQEIKDFVYENFKIFLSLELASNEEFFHAYGPSHPIAEPLHEVETRFGGSRMFLSIEKEVLDYDQAVISYQDRVFTHHAWFTGNCNWCFRKIRRWRHALRMPSENGGWRGCYCSSGCITEAIIEMNIASYYLLQLWSKIYTDIKNYGIQDFIETPAIEIPEPPPPKNVSYYNVSDNVVSEYDTIIVTDYEELADLVGEYPETLIYTLFVDDETSRGIIEAYSNEKEKLVARLRAEDKVIFVLFTVTEASNIDDTDPPELTAYYQQEVVATIVDFNDHARDVGGFITSAYQKVYST